MYCARVSRFPTSFFFPSRLTSNPHCFEPLILCLAPSLIHGHLGAQNIQQLLQNAANESAPKTSTGNLAHESNPLPAVTKESPVLDVSDSKKNSPKPKQLKLRIPSVTKECPAKDFKSYM